MTCVSCEVKIEREVSKLDGVVSVKVALATFKGHFTYDVEKTGPRDIIAAVERLGFTARLAADERGAGMLDHRKEIRKWRRSFLFSLLFGAPVMAVMIFFMIDMRINACDDSSDDVTTPLAVTSAGNVSYDVTTVQTSESCGMRMVVAGLSLENLLLFIFCTPCQVTSLTQRACYCNAIASHAVTV